MGLFGFGKKKEEKNTGCGCGCNCSGNNESKTEQSRLIVLGACCEKSSKTFENVKQAVIDLGLSEEVLNIGDMEQIASYGVMSTPALVIDGKVVSMGKLIKVDEAKEFIKQANITSEKSDCGCNCSKNN